MFLNQVEYSQEQEGQLVAPFGQDPNGASDQPVVNVDLQDSFQLHVAHICDIREA